MKLFNYIFIVWKKMILMNGFKIIVFILEIFQYIFCEFLFKVKFYNNLKYNLFVVVSNIGVVCKLFGIVKYIKIYFIGKKRSFLFYKWIYEVVI